MSNKPHQTFETPEQLHAWLHANHASETELWVRIFKKATGQPSVTWDDCVVIAICWGRIDGQRKSMDEPSHALAACFAQIKFLQSLTCRARNDPSLTPSSIPQGNESLHSFNPNRQFFTARPSRDAIGQRHKPICRPCQTAMPTWHRARCHDEHGSAPSRTQRMDNALRRTQNAICQNPSKFFI